MNFENMKVKELKEESKKRGLKLEHKGHKFTKQELIDRLVKYETEQNDDIADARKAIDETIKNETKCEDVKTCANCSKKPCEKTPKVEVKNKKEYVYAETLEEIENKYSTPKNEYIYENMCAGNLVVFVHYVEAKSGEIYKRLRSAKVVSKNEENRTVDVETILGTKKTLCYEELLYIRNLERGEKYPNDIFDYLKKQRTEKGVKQMYERFAENNTKQC